LSSHHHYSQATIDGRRYLEKVQFSAAFDQV
jgi:hypothetical protein